MDESSIDRELLRAAMLETLRRRAPEQYVNFQIYVAEVLWQRGLPVEQSQYGGGGEARLRRADERRFREITWQLINQGVLVQGRDSANDQWPWLSLTEWGDEYVRNNQPDAYDPDRYLAALDEEKALDRVERKYLSQASAAFRADLPDAAVVMLGAAAEHVLLQLAQQIVDRDPAGSAKVRKGMSGPALRLLNEVQKHLERQRESLPRETLETFESNFLGIAHLLRRSRNDAGHPALPDVERDDAFVLLRLFPAYRRWVHSVTAALKG